MIYLLQNDPRVPPGYFGELLEAWDAAHRTVRLCDGEPWPAPSRGDGIVLLGGYMGADEQEEFPFLGETVENLYGLVSRHVPVLGICLGAQLLARALGAAVHKDFLGQRGISVVFLSETAGSDPLLAGLSSPLTVLQWHQDSFEMPQQAERLGWTPICPNQIFRYGCAYGVQFHPEVNHAILSDWVLRKNAPREILEQFADVQEDFCEVARRLLGNFLAMCEAGDKRVVSV